MESGIYTCAACCVTLKILHTISEQQSYIWTAGDFPDYLRSEMEPSMNYVILDEEGRLLFNTGFPEEKGIF